MSSRQDCLEENLLSEDDFDKNLMSEDDIDNPGNWMKFLDSLTFPMPNSKCRDEDETKTDQNSENRDEDETKTDQNSESSDEDQTKSDHDSVESEFFFDEIFTKIESLTEQAISNFETEKLAEMEQDNNIDDEINVVENQEQNEKPVEEIKTSDEEPEHWGVYKKLAQQFSTKSNTTDTECRPNLVSIVSEPKSDAEKFNLSQVPTSSDKLFEEDSYVQDEFEEVDSRRDHESLVKNLTKSNTEYRPKWKSTRSESKPVVDEFNFSKDPKSKIGLKELLNLSKNSQAKNSMRGFVHKKLLSEPLKEPISKKIQRKLNFKDVVEKISKYDPLVKEFRNADQLVFPVEQEKVPFKVDNQVKPLSTKKTVSKIEEEIMQQISAVDGNVETNEKFLTERELEILNAVNLETARKVHKELQRQRILTSYQEANYRRIRKIKSKKYHRLMKKDKLKKTVEEFQKLAAEDPEKAAEKLEELDRLRALERASLKHRNTGKWAKHNKLRSKFDDKARDELGQQLQINTELMKKRSLALLPDFDVDENAGSEGESSADEVSETRDQSSKIVERKTAPDGSGEIIEMPYNYNPWMSIQPRKRVKVTLDSNKNTVSKVETSVDSNKQFFAERVKQRIRDAKQGEIDDIIRRDELDEKILDEGGVSQFESVNDNLSSTTDQVEFNTEMEDDKYDSGDLILKNQITSIGDIKKSLKMIGDDSDNEMDTDDINFNNNESQKYLREIFADTDVIDEFMKEKQLKEKEKFGKKSKTTYLPGWGSWAGTGIKENRKKKVRLVKRFERKEKRMDKKICNAIVLESYREPVTKHMVSYRPADINNVEAFELKCLKPLGSTWNPETVSHSLKEPKLITRAGAIIKPMESKIGQDDSEDFY